MSNDPATQLYTAFVAAMNARDWKSAQEVFAPVTSVNGVDTPADALVQQISGISALGPDLVSTVDVVLPSANGTMAYSRVIHHFTLAQDAMGAKATGSPIEFAEASFFWVKEGKVYKNFTIVDFDGLRSGVAEVPRVGPTLKAVAPAPEGFDLLATYKKYVDCVQRGPDIDELSNYCPEKLTVNGHEVELEQYISGIEAAKSTIEGMHWELVEAVVDNEKQQIATRVMLTGRPVKEFAGAQPTGNTVEFAEHVLYQFDGGKIKQVVQLMDLEGFRASLQKSA